MHVRGVGSQPCGLVQLGETRHAITSLLSRHQLSVILTFVRQHISPFTSLSVINRHFKSLACQQWSETQCPPSSRASLAQISPSWVLASMQH